MPGKLFLDTGGVPILKRVFDNVSGVGDVFCATSSALRDNVTRLLPAARVIVDEAPARGPLSALAHAFLAISTPWVFVVAADAPFVDGTLLATLREERRPGDEAIVPVHTRGEPLAALYARDAFLRAASETLNEGRTSMHAALDLLRVRFVPFVDTHMFSNVNTPAEYEALCATAVPPESTAQEQTGR